MIITAWILMVVFGFISSISFLRYLFLGLNNTEALFMVFSIITTAISAGIIYGGLFQ